MTLRETDYNVAVETSELPGQSTIQSNTVGIKSADYIILDNDNFGTIIVDDTSSNRTITLPTSADNDDRILRVVNDSTDGGKVTVAGEGAETINGAASVVLYDRGDAITVQSDATNWVLHGSIPAQQVQDYTAISSIGSSDQAAGHIFDADLVTNELALYKFASGALTTDEQGTYTLTNNNSATNTNGITGSDFATALNGTNQYYNQPTLIDTVPTNLAIYGWLQATDGQPAGVQYMFDKTNVANSDRIFLRLQTSGALEVIAEEGNNGNLTLRSQTILPNGSTPWYFVLINWSTNYGLRLFVNSVLESQLSAETTLMGNGTSSDFMIGADSTAGNNFAGNIGPFGVANHEFSQKEVDLLYSVRYAKPSAFSGDNYKVEGFVQKDGSSSYERSFPLSEYIVRQDSSYIYRAGTPIMPLSASDKLKIKARG
jgi:hypothetical protein